MRRIIVDSYDEQLRMSVVYRLKQKFSFDLVSFDNELTKAFFINQSRPELYKEYIYAFITQDVNMKKTDDGYFFFLTWNENGFGGILDLIKEVYDDETHWRYFIISADGNPVKLIASILNYDYGPAVSKIHLPGENYEFIP